MAALSETQVVAILVGLVTIRVAWEFLFSPLRAFPGPVIAKFTDAWRAFLNSQWHPDRHVRKWHRRWGTAVRIGPNAISISDPTMIKVIYTTRDSWAKVSPLFLCLSPLKQN